MSALGKCLIQFDIPITDEHEYTKEDVVRSLENIKYNHFVLNDEKLRVTLAHLTYENFQAEWDEKASCIHVSCHGYLTAAGAQQAEALNES